jgi:hypothetical protein
MKEILLSLNEQQRRENYIKKNYIDLYNDIIEFNKMYIKNFSQLLYHYYYNMKEIPKCKSCNNEVKFYTFNKGYRDYCSKKCIMLDEEIINKRNNKSKNTCIEKYGVDNPSKLKKIKQKIKKTNIEKYGVEYFTQTDEFKEKTKNTNIEKYGVEYFTQTDEFKERLKITNMEKYGVEYFTQTDEFKEKSKNTNIEKYGVNNYNKTEEYKEKVKNTNLKKYGEHHHMIYKSKNNLLKDIRKSQSINYYLNLLSKDYEIININKDDIELEHKKCERKFIIKKQLLYLRRIYNREICTICNPIIKNISYSEKEILNFIKDNYNGKIIENTKNIIIPYELDIYLPELKIAFEFNGLHWHSELYKDNNYHLNKTEYCLKNGINLIHIWEDNWEFKSDIVKSIILNKLGKTPNKIFARKCEIKEITDNKMVRQFLDKNHLQGFIGSTIKLGLYYDNELVSLMTFGKKRKIMKSSSKEGEFELLRFCNKKYINVVGGASKLFKYFINNFKPKEIITYADRSHSNGNLYKTLGFNFVSKTPPNYYYILDGVRRHRFIFRKNILVSDGFNTNMSEHEIMLERKIYRIYNSGNLKYTYNLFN